MNKEKPTIVLGILTLFWSLWMIFVALGHIFSWHIWHTSPLYNKTIDDLFNVLCLPRGLVGWFSGLKYVFLILGLFFLTAGVNILRFRDWARKSFVFLSAAIHLLAGLSILIISIRALISVDICDPWFLPFIFLLFACFFLPSFLIWYYFSRPAVKKTFT